MRALLPVVALAFVASCGDVSPSPSPAPTEAIGRTRSRLATSLSVTAGGSGTVTTLAYYSPGSAHPGENSVDIGAVGGTAVFHQLDYLPSDVAGGWIRTYVTKDAGYCSQWSPGSPYYNGAKLIVVTYVYATDGTYLGWHRSAYQHVSPNGAVNDAWFRWNNTSANVPAWQSADVDLGGQQANGLALGSVFGVSGSITNGPGGGLCTTGSHLHQEGSGWRGSGLFVGKGMTSRYHNVHLFDPIGGWPASGAPPYAPEFFVAPTPREEHQPIEEQGEQPRPEEDVAPVTGGAASEDAPPRVAEPSADTYAAPLEGDEHGPAAEPSASGCRASPARSSDGEWLAAAIATALAMLRSTRIRGARSLRRPRA